VAAAWFSRGCRVGLMVRIVLFALLLAAYISTSIGLIMAAALKTNSLSDILLSYNPRYSRAMDGFRTLQDLKYPLQIGTNPFQVSILSVDEPAWGVLLNFVRSETAIRKSERNEPSNLPSLPSPTSTPSSPPATGSTSPPPAPPPATETTPAQINFDRIKTIIGLQRPVATAGPKPLIPPYILGVFWQNSPGQQYDLHSVYEFLSFEEFRLDLKHMILDEMEGWSLWIAFIAFLVGLFAQGMRQFATWGGPRRLG
jgi:hypothetical protein